MTKQDRGPKTSAGKAAVRRNAMKHGFSSPHPVIIEGIETAEDWERHLQGVLDSLAPEGSLEEILAERIAWLLWRLDRVGRQETALINHRVVGTEDQLLIGDAYLAEDVDNVPDPAPQRVRAHQHARLMPLERDLNLLMRYETRLHRQCLQTIDLLETLQARRRGEPTHLARISFH